VFQGVKKKKEKKISSLCGEARHEKKIKNVGVPRRKK
jgi:hypothetical protein